MKKSNKNVSQKVKNGTFVTISDHELEHGKNTKSHNDTRIAVVIDTNRQDHLAILKRQHCKNGIWNGSDCFNPNIKTKNNQNNPLKIDQKHIRIVKGKVYSPNQANELKRKALKEQPKNVRKPNRRRLKELKGRK